MREDHIKKKRSFARQFIRKQLESVKSEVREAYSIQAQMNLDNGYEPSERDLKLIEDQAVNLKLVEKLEKMKADLNEDLKTRKADADFIEKRLPTESKTLLHFFYIVRLAQQGFFQLISASHPSLETQAVQYVCDTLISNSIRASRSNTFEDRLFYNDTVWEVYTGLVDERDESVGKGYKTTYKDIMDAAHSLIDDAISQTSTSASTTSSVKDASSSTKTLDTSPPTPPMQPPPPPPVWFVMPYTSMIDPHMLTISGSIPFTLPLPSAHNSKEKRNSGRSNNRREHRRGDRERDSNKDTKDDSTTTPPTTQDVEEKKNVEKAENNVETDKNEDVVVVAEDNESVSDDEEDKFADPDLSDDEDDEEDDDDVHHQEKEEKAENDEPKKTTAEEEVDTPVNAVNTTVEEEGEQQKESLLLNESEAAAKANSSWLNFAASSTPPDSPSSHSSRRSSQNYQRTKKY